jgi:hypothetical protein
MTIQFSEDLMRWKSFSLGSNNKVVGCEFGTNLFKGEYVLTTLMLAKKDIFGDWTKCHMCGDYCLVNK